MPQDKDEIGPQQVSVPPILTPEDKIKAIESAYPKIIDLTCYDDWDRINQILKQRNALIEMMKLPYEPAAINFFRVFSKNSIRDYFEACFLLDFKKKVFPRLYDAGLLTLDSAGRGKLLLKEIRAYLFEFEGTVLDPKVLFDELVHPYNGYFNTFFREICGSQFQSNNAFGYIRLYTENVQVVSLELEKMQTENASSSNDRPLNRGLYWVMQKRMLSDSKKALESISLLKMSEKIIFLKDEIFLIDSLLLDDNSFKNKEEKQALLFQAICLIRHEHPALYQALKRFDAIAQFDQLFSMLSTTKKTFKDIFLETIEVLKTVGASHDGNTGLFQLPPVVVEAMINFTNCLDSVRKRFPQVSNLQDIHGNRLSYFHRTKDTRAGGRGQPVQGEEVCIEKIRSLLTLIYQNNRSHSLMQVERLNLDENEIMERLNALLDRFPSVMRAHSLPSCSLYPKGQIINAFSYLYDFVHHAIYGGRGRFEENLGQGTLLGQQIYIRVGYFLHSAVDDDFSARVMTEVIPEIERILNRKGSRLSYKEFDYIRSMLHYDQMPLFYKLFFNGNLDRFCRVMSGYKIDASGLQLIELPSVISSLQLPNNDKEWSAFFGANHTADHILENLTVLMAFVVPGRLEDLLQHKNAIQEATKSLDPYIIGKMLSKRLLDFSLSSEALEKVVDFLIEFRLLEKINFEEWMSRSPVYQYTFEFDYAWYMTLLRTLLSRTTALQREYIAPFLLMFVFDPAMMQLSTENQRKSIRFNLMKLLFESEVEREGEIEGIWLRLESAIDSRWIVPSDGSPVVTAEPDPRCFTDSDFIRDDRVFEMFLRLCKLNCFVTLAWSKFYYQMLKSILSYRGLDDFLKCALYADRMEQQAILLMMYQENFMHKIDKSDHLRIIFTMLFNVDRIGDPYLSLSRLLVRGNWRDKIMFFKAARNDCRLFHDIQTYFEVKNLFFLLNTLHENGKQFNILFQHFSSLCLSLFVKNQYSLSFLYPQFLSLDQMPDFFKFMLLNVKNLEANESYALLLAAVISLKPDLKFSVANFEDFFILLKFKNLRKGFLSKCLSVENRLVLFEHDILQCFQLLPHLDEEMVLKLIASVDEASFYQIKKNIPYLNLNMNLRDFLYLILLQSSCLDRNESLLLEKSQYTLKYDKPLSPPELVLAIFQYLDALNSHTLKSIVLKKLIDFDFTIMSEILTSLPAIKQWMLRLEDSLLIDFLKKHETRIIKIFETRPTEGLIFMTEAVTPKNRFDDNFRLAKIFSRHAPALFDLLMRLTFFPVSQPDLFEKVSMMALPQMPYFYGLFATFDEFSKVARQLQAMGHFDESAINENAYSDFKALCRKAKVNAALQAGVMTSENDEAGTSVYQSSPKRHHAFFPQEKEPQQPRSGLPSPGPSGDKP